MKPNSKTSKILRGHDPNDQNLSSQNSLHEELLLCAQRRWITKEEEKTILDKPGKHPIGGRETFDIYLCKKQAALNRTKTALDV